MKLLLAILIFLVAVPMCVTLAVEGLATRTANPVDVEVVDLAHDRWPESDAVQVEGYLVRGQAPDDLLSRGGYWFPLVGEDEASAVRSLDTWLPPAGRPPLLAYVQGDLLPVEAFLAPAAGKRMVVTPPIVLEGRQSHRSVPADILRRLGLPDGSEAIVLRSPSARITRAGGVIMSIVGVLFTWWGVRLIRSRRRQRREQREQSRPVAAGPPPLPGKPSGAASTPRMRPRLDLPWGKVAVVVVMLGAAGAQLARRAAPAAADVARGIAKTSDETAGAARAAAKNAPESGSKLELPSVGDLAESAAGQASNARTALSLPGQEKVPAARSGRRASLRLTDRILETSETYERGSGMTFELVKRSAISEQSGSLDYGEEVSETNRDSDLPDRMRGEFTRVELAPGSQPGTVRLSQTAGLSVEGGYIEPFSASGDLEFLHGGSWEGLERGDISILRFTDPGVTEFAQGLLAFYEHHARAGLDEQGATDQRVRVEWVDAPRYRITVEDGGLEFELVRPAKANVSASFRM